MNEYRDQSLIPRGEPVRKYDDEPPLDPKSEWKWWWMKKFKTLDRQWAESAWANTAARGYIEQG